MDKKIEELCKLNNITSKAEIDLTKKAIIENKDSIVLDQEIFTSKKWAKFKTDLENFKSQPKPKIKIQIKQFPIYTRFSIQQKPCQDKIIKSIVMGPCGNGKTTLINLLCGSQLQTGHTKSSLTRQVTEMESLEKYDLSFIIYDTPGTTAHVDKLRHAIHLKELLCYRPINSVIILVKYQSRFDEVVNNIYRQVKMLQNYSENIIFLISHFDLAQDPKFFIQQTDKMFNQLKINNQIIFYSNNGVNEKQLSDKIYRISKSMPQRQIQIDEKTFFKYFNLKKEQTEEIYFKEEQKQILTEMQEITDIYIQNALSLPNSDQRDAIFQDLQVSLKNQLQQLFDGFILKFQNTMSGMEYYSSYFTIQLKINENLKQYQQKIRSLQKYNFIQSTTNQDIRDLIKKCPNKNCGLVWFRVQACPNTVCGKRPSCFFDFVKSKFFCYRIIRQKNTRKLKIVKAEQNVNKKKDILNEKTIVSNTSIQQRVKKDKVGCGQSMNFSTLPRLPNIEELLIEFYNVHTIEEVIVRFNEEEQLKQISKKIQIQAKRNFLEKFSDCWH